MTLAGILVACISRVRAHRRELRSLDVLQMSSYRLHANDNLHSCCHHWANQSRIPLIDRKCGIKPWRSSKKIIRIEAGVYHCFSFSLIQTRTSVPAIRLHSLFVIAFDPCQHASKCQLDNRFSSVSHEKDIRPVAGRKRRKIHRYSAHQDFSTQPYLCTDTASFHVGRIGNKHLISVVFLSSISIRESIDHWTQCETYPMKKHADFFISNRF